jgi:glycosyltransferase involved in cell wall biosynthesis
VGIFGTRPVRVAVVASVIARYDGISTAVRHTVQALRGAEGCRVSVFAPQSDFPELRAVRVQSAAELRTHRAFRAADLVVYHFGIFSPVFETMAQRERHQRAIIAFHNVTPPELVPPAERPLLEQSLRQMEAVRHVDRLWAESPVSVDALTAAGVIRDTVDIIPPAVDRPPGAALAGKPAPPVRLLFVGRLVRAKGVLDLIEALDLVRARTDIPFRLDIAGNEAFSDPAYAAEAKADVIRRGLSPFVHFAGAVEDETRDALYRDAHLLAIPSYHEGFCRPVIEGLRAGCVPVGYAAHNLPHVTHGLGRMVRTGDRNALAAALVELIVAVVRGGVLPLDGGPLGPAEFDDAARRYVAEFTSERVADLKLRSIRTLLNR